MPRRLMERMNGPRPSGWFLAVCAAVAAVGVAVQWSHATALRDRGLRAPATVVEVVRAGRDNSVVVTFTTRDGESVRTEVGSWYWRPEPRRGDVRDVLYDPDDPAGNVSDVRIGPDFTGAWLTAGLAALFAALSLASFRGRIDWNEWARYPRRK